MLIAQGLNPVYAQQVGPNSVKHMHCRSTGEAIWMEIATI